MERRHGGVIRVDQLVGGLIRVDVPLHLGHCRGDVRAQVEVDELVRVARVRRVDGHDDAVDAEADALAREHGHEVRVLHQRIDDVGREQVRGLDLAGDQIVVAHVVVEDADVRLQLLQLRRRLGQLGLVGGVVGVAQHLQHLADDDARVVNQPEGVRKLLVPQVGERRDLALDLRRVVHDHRRTGGVGHRVGVLRIEELAEIVGIEVVPVGQKRLVQLHQQALARRRLHRVVAGDDDVVFRTAIGLQPQQHLLVGGERRVVDLDARLFGELRKRRLVEIAFPGEDVEHLLLFLLCNGSAAKGREDRRKQQCEELLHENQPPIEKVVGETALYDRPRKRRLNDWRAGRRPAA